MKTAQLRRLPSYLSVQAQVLEAPPVTDGPRARVQDEIERVHYELSRTCRKIAARMARVRSFSPAPFEFVPEAASDYDDGIVWDLIDPDSIGISPPIASYTVQTRFEKVEPGQFAPLDVDEVDLELFDADWCQPLQERLKYLGTLTKGWDSYGAEAPNDFALQMAQTTLQLLAREGLEPRGIVPSAENGIGFVFRKGDLYADIEIFNDGDVYYLTDDRKSRPQAHQVASDSSGISEALQAISAFLNS